MTVSELNHLNEEQARQLFEQCCAAQAWVNSMVTLRPFADQQTLYNSANNVWRTMNEEDLLQAFQAHPQIGDAIGARIRFANSKTFETEEQDSIASTSEDTLQALAYGNKQYLNKFGFIFFICATQKTAEEMLECLQMRLHLSRKQELINAAEEQRKIIALRLQKMLQVEHSPSKRSER